MNLKMTALNGLGSRMPISQINMNPKLIVPKWTVPKSILAYSTTRQKGFSCPPFDGFNLATHVGDDLHLVNQNRQALMQFLQQQTAQLNASASLKSITWLDQRHTTQAIEYPYFKKTPPVADACWTTQPNVVCTVMTADCVPILITNQTGSLVCAIHAGWKGLVTGIVEQTLSQLPEKPEHLIAWIGPAISQSAFEVGAEVYDIFAQKGFEVARHFKIQHNNHLKEVKYLADLPGLTVDELKRLGVEQISQSGLCTYQNEQDFYSYRRDGQTGRIASLIWMTPS